MLRNVCTAAAIVFAIMTASPVVLAEDIPPELAPMVEPLDAVEAMMADGTYANGEFSTAVSPRDASAIANTIKNRLRNAKSEYSRLPRNVRSSKEADKQWYRMDALIKTSDGFSAALQRHAKAVAERDAANANAHAVPATTPVAPVATMPQVAAPSTRQTEAEAKAAERKREAEARAAALRAQQEQVRARAAEVQAEKEAATRARAAGVEPSGDDWQNAYIPNIKELQSHDGFFQWPWSAPSWKAVTDKAAAEQAKGALGSGQVARFTDFVLDKAGAWPAVPRVDDAGDAQYALDMIRKRETADGLKVVDLWISRGDWKIQRNGLGVIES